MAARGHRRTKATRKPKPLGLLLIPVTALAFWVGASHVDQARERLENILPIQYVRVEGAIWNLDTEAFQQAVMPHAQRGYFSVDLKAIEAAAGAFAWIDRVETNRAWPDTIVLRIVEHTPVARWNEDSLLNEQGKSFTPPNAGDFTRLPSLAGPPGHEAEVLGMMRQLDAKLEPREMRVAALRLSKRLAWEAELEGGLEIVFGNQDPLAATVRLLALLPALTEQLGQDRIAAIRRLDLRYPNGFSVVWKPEIPPPSAGSLG